VSNESSFDPAAFIESLVKSLLTIDNFGCKDYRNHLPRWVYLLLLIGLTWAAA